MDKDLNIVMNVKKRISFLLIIPMIAVSAYFLGISFSISKLNSLVFVIAFISFVFLSRLCSSLKLKWYFDLMLAVGWIFTILFGLFLLLDLIDHRNPDLSKIRDTEFCTRSGYGFVGSDGGMEMRAYRRFWIFDKEIGNYRMPDPDVYRNSNSSPIDTMGVHKFCKDKKIIELR